MRRSRKYNSETNLQIQVADYLCLQYPDVIFHSDYGSGANLTISQAITQKRLNGGRRAFPDMFIAEQKHWHYDSPCREACDDDCFAGLFIEVKKDGTKLKREKDCAKILKGETKLRKAGDWWDLHIEEQAEMLENLRDRGYKAEFAVGLEEAKRMIDEYLGGSC